jgi:predicted nucleic acid-binding protein
VIVVANTSPLTNLAAIGQFDLLRRLYGHALSLVGESNG